jgi:death-on-curing protein
VKWLSVKAIRAIHEELIAEHGGSAGVLNEGVIDSTLARPRNLHAYREAGDLPRLAASLGYGFARNHCFVDGNKRVAFAAADVFLRINGFKLGGSAAEKIAVMLDVAKGEMTEETFAEWVRTNMERQ